MIVTESMGEILERGHADLVNTAYGLTAEEVELQWETVPPRLARF